MEITRTSVASGITRTRDLPVTEDQLRRIEGNEKIQNVVPHLSESDREFILTGMTDEEWDEMFGEDDSSEESEFIHCDKCDGHDACEDFGCAIELGLGRMVKKISDPGL